MFASSRSRQWLPSLGRTLLPRLRAAAPAVLLILAASVGNVMTSSAHVGDDAHGKKLFLAYCSTCHGVDGKGNGPAAAAMVKGYNKHPRDLTNHAYFSRKTDAQLLEVIKWSGEKEQHGSLLPMPQWAFRLNDQEITDLVAYVRVLSAPSHITGDAAAGKKVFMQYCSACHGVTGNGSGPISRAALGVKPRNFTDKAVMKKLSDRDVYNTIRLGGEGVGRSAWMPAWGSTLSDSEIDNLVVYIRSLAGAPPKPTPSKH